MVKYNKKIMELAIEEAKKSVLLGEGSPFGAVIVDRENNIIATGRNMMDKKFDVTSHGEIEAIRNATEKLKTLDLSGYILYSSAEPCPMCKSAILWAKIPVVYYGTSSDDGHREGFSDKFIYEELKGEANSEKVKYIQMDRNDAIEAYNLFRNKK
ncbi:nucleoside deaminase [Clostridium hydrogeniformans]|uniref:nucleoside deaminase n=1 Tax=Clostridium hydrogeniformans TaxID=349933 RepID=UPI00047F94CB|nr:nucleoside deaminase [Clostridium hydrogeniformans]